MLEKLVLQNFKSFKERTEIYFNKTNYSMLSQNVANNGILKGTLFVGPNASGKSNILSAIKFLLDSLFENTNLNSDIYRCLFSNKDSFSIEYYFLINENHIVYTIDINQSRPYIEENLLLDDKLMFQRMGQDAKSFIAYEEGQIFDKNDIDEETLFLRTLYFNTKFKSNETLFKWMDFLRNSVYFNAHKSSKEWLDRASKELDIISYLKDNGEDSINEFFEKYGFDQSIQFAHEAKSNYVTFIAGSNQDERRIYFRRKGIDIPIPFVLESLGNQNLLQMLPSFFEVILEGGILLIDEFSSGLHNDLEELLIRYFMDNSTNSQLIFVSHSTNLLSNSLLRPDQEYSVEFNGNNGSSVKRFSSEQPRMAQNVEKMYLSGVFGGLPHYEKGINGDSNK